MTYEEIVSRVRDIIYANDLSVLKEYPNHIAVQVNITGEGEGAFYIELKDGEVYIEPYEYYDRDCKFIVSGDNFIKICEGSLGAVKAFTVGKLKVEGSIDKALEFSKIVESVKPKDKKKK